MLSCQKNLFVFLSKCFIRRRGSFLLEALLAVLILSVGLVGLIRGLLSSLNAAKEAQAYSRATIAADNALLDVIRLNGVKTNLPIKSDVSVGELAAEINVVASSSVHVPRALREAHIVVKWPGALKEKEIRAVTLVFGPTDENE